MNAARDRFRVGDRVRLTAEARQMFLLSRTWHGQPIAYRGVVRGFGRRGRADRIVLVQRDGHRSAEGWHEQFWELLSDGCHTEDA